MTVWELPSPGSFVRRVADAFRDGRNVIVRFPRHRPDGFWLALRGEYERDPILEITRLHCDGHEGSPLELLFREFGSNASINALHDMATLTSTPLFFGRLVSIEGLRSEQWPAWRTFLSDYEQVCRNVDQLQRTLFFAQMDSEWDPAPVEDVCLAVFSWDDTLDETDISLFAARQLISKRLAPLERRLIISLLSELSLWDTVLCVQLANHSLETLIVPERQLQTFAHQRGWTAAIPRAQWWNFGIEASVVGFRQKHSAFLALLGEERALGQRIWRAQLRVVFPAIEELRLALLPCLKPQLRFPLATASGLVHEIEELEIGEIAYHLQKTRSVDPEIRRLVHLLKDLRHALAHLEPIRDGTRLRRLCQVHEQLLYRSTNSA